MSCRNNGECNQYLCQLESEILPLLCAKLVHCKLIYYINLFKNYVIKINKIPISNKLTKEKRAIMIDQLNGIISAYELVYSSPPDDSDDSLSGNGSSDEDYVINIHYH